MSNSFADLWASSAPTKSIQQQPQQKLSSNVPPRRPQYDAFSILSASQPPTGSKPVVNNQLSNDRQARKPQANSNGGDAFSALFTPSLDGTTASRNSDRANMTMAERAALAQKANSMKHSAPSVQSQAAPGSSSLWDGLDALVRPMTTSPRPPAFAPGGATTRDSFDFGFDGVATSKAKSSPTSPTNNILTVNDDWGLSELTSPSASESRSVPAPTKPVPESKHASLWDLDEFGSPESQTYQPQPQPPSRSLTGTPGDFDFGDREDGLSKDEDYGEDTFGIRGRQGEHVEDDILGDLGKPVSHSHSPSLEPLTSTRSPPRTADSPPPHVTGQLVEMGFSPIDARAALVNTMTDSGFDVQAATELLLSQSSQEEFVRPSPQPSETEQHRDRDRPGARDQAVRRPPARTEPHYQSNGSRTQPQPQLDITAEKLISQASEIGRGMFTKANALWKEGKERAVKLYEERAASASVASGAPSLDGRPRWMQDRDHVPNGLKRAGETGAVQAGFKDDEEEGEERQQREKERPPISRPRQAQNLSQSQPLSQPEREREIDLFSADSSVTTYQSPFRRGKAKAQAAAFSVQPSLSAPTSSTQASPFTTSSSSTSQWPPARPRTFTTTVTLSALSTSTSHKSAGTDAYKRGDFPVALAAYTRALSALPPEHVLRVPILTNIALVRSKVGELMGTVKACEDAIVIVRRFSGGENGRDDGEGEGMSFTGTDSIFDEKTPVEVGTGKVSVSVQDGGGVPSNGDLPTSVDLVEGLSKAFRRRAEALESLEKWERARSTWEVLHSAEWAGAGVKGEAIKGVGRCRRMVDGDAGVPSQSAPPKPKSKPTSTPRSHPKPKPVPSASASLPSSAALDALRSTHDAQQVEDATRLACKDSVDSRLTAWKSGREGNIRALLTSLDDTILWSELGWRKVGMAEVVSKGQVKGAYVRAIARVHPDKLNTGNTTVEQRMVANGVFGALNEAWNVFQQQQ
ncbi:hypothetical protein JVU11DRAFT_11362 [Chiua virens]|nr:hypothetical protein JVU11DRAFT_11362 [Chiua virens]